MTMPDKVHHEMIDVAHVTEIEVKRARDGRVWVNLDGQCVLRAISARNLVIEDERQGMRTIL